jgi:glycosyltransferase involved in cell wall biosynthesis
LIRESDISIIIVQSPSIDGYLASRLAKKLGKEMIVEIHGDYINSLFYYFDFPKIAEMLLRRLFIFFGSRSLAQADKIRVISSATEKLARTYSRGQKIYKFPTFTDIDIFKNEKETSWQPIIFWAGAIYKLKGLQFLISAFAKLKQKYPDFLLVIWGKGPYKNELIRMAKESGSNIQFDDWRSQEEVKNLMKRCWLYCLPSLSEGLGRVLIEAAMLKKPLVGSNVGGIPDIIQDGVNGFLFKPGSVEDLTEKLDKLMGDKELAIKMGEAGRKYVEDKFSTDKYFEDYIRMVNE